MQNEIIINADPGETRVAVLERSSFTELYIERDNERGVAGNVVKGRVSRVLPGMQAAFVDIGLEKAGFLFVGDYYPNLGEGANSNGNRRRRGGRGGNRSLQKIESVLEEGQEIVVQIAKEPIGSKGARITSNISIPGRHLVLTPGAGRIGVSRRIESDRERKRLREIVERLRVDDLGFIIRTAGHGVREADLEADVRYLTSVWNDIQKNMKEHAAPAVLYSELDLPIKMVRDLVTPETKRIAIDNESVHARLNDFVDRFVADPKPRIEHYTGAAPIFDEYSLESQIHDNLERKVGLKSGGHLVIDQSEALTAIDVNTGRYTGKRDLEETIFRTNLEAIREVVYQLRFRNIGGLIIIDLIDMDSADHREKVYRSLQEAIRQDKARTNILKISELGLLEMTRKRTRENLMQVLCEPCSNCEGRGYVLSRTSVAFKVLREIRNDLPRFCGRRIAITVAPRVAEQLLSGGKDALAQLGEELGREIEVRARPGLHQEQFEVSSLDEGPAVVLKLSWLEKPKPEDEKPATSRRSRGRRGRGRGRDSEAASEAGEETSNGEATTESPEDVGGELAAEGATEVVAEVASEDAGASADSNLEAAASDEAAVTPPETMPEASTPSGTPNIEVAETNDGPETLDEAKQDDEKPEDVDPEPLAEMTGEIQSPGESDSIRAAASQESLTGASARNESPEPDEGEATPEPPKVVDEAH